MKVYLFFLGSLLIFLTVFYKSKFDDSSLFTRKENSGSVKKKKFTGEKMKSTGEEEIVTLLKELKSKLDQAEASESIFLQHKSCSQLGVKNYNDSICSKKTRTCFKSHLSEDPKEKLKSLVPDINILEEFSEALQLMRSQVKTQQEVIIAHALSSNHYLESQAMFENFHKQLYPALPNFTLVAYDLGLTDAEHEEMKKYCRCTLIKFPFSKLPSHVSDLMCYAWKVFIIAAHLPQAEVLMWSDASIRVKDTGKILEMIQQTKERGVQWRKDKRNWQIPKFTHAQVFEYFGDSPCAYFNIPMVEGNFGFLHSSPLINRAVIHPLIKCAADPRCMCPPQYRGEGRKCSQVHGNNNNIGQRHCFDQSALTVILGKLFREKINHFLVESRANGAMSIERDKRVKYYHRLAAQGA